MCVTSVVSDYYLQTWPTRFPAQPSPFQTDDRELKDLMRKTLKLLDRIDKRLGDKECIEPAKAAFYAQVGFSPDAQG